MSTTKTLPRVIARTHPPAFVIEDHEIDLLAPLPANLRMPFSGFVDEDGKTHFELNVWGWTPEPSFAKSLIWMLRPDLFLSEFFDRIVRTSLVRSQRKTVAALAGMFYGAERKAVIHFVATRPRSRGDLPEGHAVRAQALRIIATELDRLLRWLGADRGETSPCIIGVDKMSRIGWSVKTLRLLERARVFRQGLPVSVRHTPRIFVKRYAHDLEVDQRRTDPPRVVTVESA